MLAEHGRECLERLAPPPRSSGMEDMPEGYLWMAEESRLKPVHRIARINLDLLKRLEAQREALVANTRAYKSLKALEKTGGVAHCEES